MSDDTTVRLAVSRDQDAIERCVHAAYALYLERMDQRPAPMVADYATLIDAGTIHLIGDRLDVRALIVLFLEDDHLFIENIAVHPEHQGSGLGRQLMNYAENMALQNGLAEIRLYTNELMFENFGYYERLGFKVTDRRTEDGFERVYFRKKLV